MMKIIFLLIFLALSTAVLASGDKDDEETYYVESFYEKPWGFECLLKVDNVPVIYEKPITPLLLSVWYETESRVRIKITDNSAERWEVPSFITHDYPEVKVSPKNLKYSVHLIKKPFGISVKRDGDVIFDTNRPSGKRNLVFEDHYIEINTTLEGPNPNVYGIGERRTSFRLDTNHIEYPIWARDQGQGTIPMANLYGQHPFHEEIRKDGKAHGILLLNSNAMSIQVHPDAVTYRTIGGVIDFYVFVGPGPYEVLDQYYDLVGRTALPPYWALGWHQSRWGYHSAADVEKIVTNFNDNGIPLDVTWIDIDYMDNFLDFTYDPTKFPISEMNDFVKNLHAQDKHYVPLVDCGIAIKPGYKPYDELIEQNAYIKNATNNGPAWGKVWPGMCVWPDWFHPNSTSWWLKWFEYFNELVPFDGVCTDMNEISSFLYRGEKGRPSEGFDPDNPPYVPTVVPLKTGTIDMASRHYLDGKDYRLEYNTHGLFGYMEGVATKKALEKIRDNGRALIVSRSTFIGSGNVTTHWLGDNHCEWSDYRDSIAGMLTMNVFGIPVTGSDICGFEGNTTRELCARWTALGSLYGLALNHNGPGDVPQEPYAFDDEFTGWAKVWILNRIAILPYFYTSLYEMHVNGPPLMRSLAFEYPTDPNTWSIDLQFLIGGDLLVSPALEKGATTVKAYIPKGTWRDWITGSNKIVSTGQWENLSAPLHVIPILMRDGAIIPMQAPGLSAHSTRKKNPFGLIAAVNENGEARGQLFWDDGDTTGTIEAGKFTLIDYAIKTNDKNTTLTGTLMKHNYDMSVYSYENLRFYGVANPTTVMVNGETLSKDQYRYDSQDEVLSVSDIKASVAKDLEMIWYI